MIVRVLGAAGSEVPGHNCPAFLIDGQILLDAGTIAVALHIREERDLRWILLSHVHFDHIKGIPFLVDNLVTRATGNTIAVVSGADVLDDLREHVFNGRVWPDFTAIPSPANGALRYTAVDTERSFALDGYHVTMERVSHTVPAYGFIVEKPGEGAIAYTGDTGPTERFWARMAEHEVAHLILETSFPNRLEKLALVSGHLTPALLEKELAKMARRPARVSLMHLKPQFFPEIEAEIRALGLDGLGILTDGDVLRT